MEKRRFGGEEEKYEALETEHETCWYKGRNIGKRDFSENKEIGANYIRLVKSNNPVKKTGSRIIEKKSKHTLAI